MVVRKLSVKKLVESWPYIKNLEMAWFKTGDGKWVPGAESRYEDFVVLSVPPEGAKSQLHTHPSPRRLVEFMVPREQLASLADLMYWTHLLKDHGIRKFHIALMRGHEVAGYASYKLSPEMIERLPSILGTLGGSQHDYPAPIHAAVLKSLINEGVVKQRLTPAEGYRFDGRRDKFVKK